MPKATEHTVDIAELEARVHLAELRAREVEAELRLIEAVQKRRELKLGRQARRHHERTRGSEK